MVVATKFPAVVQPFRFVLALTVSAIAIETIFRLVLAYGAPDLPPLRGSLITGSVFSVVATALLTWLGWWGASGLLRGTSLRNIGLYWPSVLFALLPLAIGFSGIPQSITIDEIEIAVLAGVLTAWWKVVLLGMFVVALQHRGPWRAALLVASLFGVLHLDGLLIGAPPLQTVLLGLSYALLAFAFAALRLCTNVAWPQFIIYALFLVLSDLILPTQVAARGFSLDTLTGRVVITAILALYSAIVLGRSLARREV